MESARGRRARASRASQVMAMALALATPTVLAVLQLGDAASAPQPIVSDPSTDQHDDGHFKPPQTTPELEAVIDRLLSSSTVVIFHAGACSVTDRVTAILEDLGLPYHAVDLDVQLEGVALRKALAKRVGSGRSPKVFVRGRHVRNVPNAISSGELEHWVASEPVEI